MIRKRCESLPVERLYLNIWIFRRFPFRISFRRMRTSCLFWDSEQILTQIWSIPRSPYLPSLSFSLTHTSTQTNSRTHTLSLFPFFPPQPRQRIVGRTHKNEALAEYYTKKISQRGLEGYENTRWSVCVWVCGVCVCNKCMECMCMCAVWVTVW